MPELHLVLVKKQPCGEFGCPETAHRLMRCPRCRDVIARCGAHDHRFTELQKEHCPDMTTCRSCKAEIEWGEWAGSGKPVPLDAKPHPRGNLVLIAGKVRHYTEEDTRLGRDRRQAHFASCPDSDRWRNNQ